MDLEVQVSKYISVNQLAVLIEPLDIEPDYGGESVVLFGKAIVSNVLLQFGRNGLELR